MALLQVRDFPEDTYKKVTQIARRQNRTIAQQVIVLLEASLGQEESNIERRKRLLQKIEDRCIPDEVKKIDAVTLVRKDRER